MTGIDIPIPEIQVTIHQPTILELSYLGEENFSIAIAFLLINKKDYGEQAQSISNFEIFCGLINLEENSGNREKVIDFLKILFPNYNIVLTPQSIILMNQEQGNKIIDVNNFEILQELLADMLCINGDKESKFNPKGKLAESIAKKIEQGRAKIAKQKGKQDGGLSSAISSLTIVMRLPIHEITKLTLYQVYDLLKRYSLYTSWKMDIQVRLNPMVESQKDQVEDWMRNIH